MVNESVPSVPDAFSTTFGLSDLQFAFLSRYLSEDRAATTSSMFNFPVPKDEYREIVETTVISSLIARGHLLLEEEREAIVPAGEAMILTAILQAAEAWTTFQVTDGGAGGDAAILVESPVGKFFAQPRAFDTWWFVLIDPAVPGYTLTSDTVVRLAQTAERTAVFTRFRTGELDRSLTIHQQAGKWSYAFGESGAAEPEERQEDVDRSAFDAAFERYFADLPVIVAAGESGAPAPAASPTADR